MARREGRWPHRRGARGDQRGARQREVGVTCFTRLTRLTRLPRLLRRAARGIARRRRWFMRGDGAKAGVKKSVNEARHSSARLRMRDRVITLSLLGFRFGFRV